MPYVPKSDGRGYGVFPALKKDPDPLELSGKLYTKVDAGVTQLYFQADNGTVYQVTPGGGAAVYPFQLPETATPAPLANNGKLYSKDVAGVSQLFFLDDAGTETQLTPPVGFYYAYIIWRSAAPSGAGHVQTWAEVESLIAATQGKITIAVDGNATIPNTALTQCFGRVVFTTYNNSSTATIITVDDGGQLISPFQFEGRISLQGAPTIRPFIHMNPDTILQALYGAEFVLNAGATISGIEIDGFGNVSLFQGANVLDNSGTPGISVVQLLPGSVCINTMLSLILTTPGPQKYISNMFGGDASTTLVQLYDAGAPAVNQVNMLGGTLSIPVTYAAGLAYDDSVTPTTGAAFVQTIVDILKRRVTGFGNTAGRPAIPADIDTGGMYFDTDLGIPVWSNGAIYVDATGAPV